MSSTTVIKDICSSTGTSPEASDRATGYTETSQGNCLCVRRFDWQCLDESRECQGYRPARCSRGKKVQFILLIDECLSLAQSASTEPQNTQVLKIEKLKPSTSYRFTIVAKSRAGDGQQTGPIQFRTLDRQIPEFKIVPTEENKNDTCTNDRSCVIRWNIESDGGAPIVRAEILYAKVQILTCKFLGLTFVRSRQRTTIVLNLRDPSVRPCPSIHRSPNTN